MIWLLVDEKTSDFPNPSFSAYRNPVLTIRKLQPAPHFFSLLFLTGRQSKQKNIKEFRYRWMLPLLRALCLPHLMQLRVSPGAPMAWNGVPFSLTR